MFPLEEQSPRVLEFVCLHEDHPEVVQDDFLASASSVKGCLNGRPFRWHYKKGINLLLTREMQQAGSMAPVFKFDSVHEGLNVKKKRPETAAVWRRTRVEYKKNQLRVEHTNANTHILFTTFEY